MVTTDKTHSPPPSATYFRVFLRLRPASVQSSISPSRFLHLTADPLNSSEIPRSIHVTPPATSKTRPLEKFTFQRVFDEHTPQLDIFRETVLPLIQDAVMGKDAMLATLGVTGSGKTHTILGSKNEKGMTQMALEVVFTSVEGKLVEVSDGSRRGGVDLQAGDKGDAFVMNIEEFRQRMKSVLVSVFGFL